MSSIKAIFIKQAKDLVKNPMILIEFIIFPVVAWVMTALVAKPNPDIPNNMFISMMAPIFAGMALITVMTASISEDIERKSLRFLIMAGVKPHQYLIGSGGFQLIAGMVVTIWFALLGDFTGQEFLKFFIVMFVGVIASILLGASIGMLSKNSQSATATAMPFALILGFVPMLAQFNESLRTIANVLYTQQLNVIINDFTANFGQALIVIAANIAVLMVVFIIASRRKGLSR